MADDFLNQDEIEALLSGATPASIGGTLSDHDLTVLKEVAGVFAGAAENVVGMLAGRGVTTEVSVAEEIAQKDIAVTLGDEKIFSYKMVLDGFENTPAQIITTVRGALALADMMMGGDAKDLPAEANDLYLSASQEGLSQLVGTALTSLSGLLGGIRLVAGETTSSLEDAANWIPFVGSPADAPAWRGEITLNVEGVDPFAFVLVIPGDKAKRLAEEIEKAMAPKEEAAPAPQAAVAAPKTAVPAAAVPAGGGGISLPPRAVTPPVDVRPAEFGALPDGDFAGVPANIDLIVDIPVRVTVELGRTRKTIGEILSLGPGSVVELNKTAGEPVDVLVNGKLIARGEVVVIDESFGIRVTEVVSRTERIRSMGA